MQCTGFVSTCFAKGGPFEGKLKEMREDSVMRVWLAIKTHCTRPSVILYNDILTTLNMWQKIWNQFCDWIGQSKRRYTDVQMLENILERFNVSDPQKRKDFIKELTG